MLPINSVYGLNKSQPNFKRNYQILKTRTQKNHQAILKAAGAVAAIGLTLGGGYQWGVAASEDKLVQAEETYKKAEILKSESCKAVDDITLLAHEELQEQAVMTNSLVQQAKKEKQARLNLISNLNDVKKKSHKPGGLFGWGGYQATAKEMANSIEYLQDQAKIKTYSFDDYKQNALARIDSVNVKIDSIKNALKNF